MLIKFQFQSTTLDAWEVSPWKWPWFHDNKIWRLTVLFSVLHLTWDTFYWLDNSETNLKILYSNTAHLYRKWKTSDLFWNKSQGGCARRYLAPFRRHSETLLTSVFVAMTLDDFYQVKNVRNACKHQGYSQNCWWHFFMRWCKDRRIWRIQLLFSCFLCVRIEIDQLLCLICWIINHSLSVSCKKINHSCSALVIWSSLQLNTSQWFITQQITTRADLFLK